MSVFPIKSRKRTSYAVGGYALQAVENSIRRRRQCSFFGKVHDLVDSDNRPPKCSVLAHERVRRLVGLPLYICDRLIASRIPSSRGRSASHPRSACNYLLRVLQWHPGRLPPARLRDGRKIDIERS